MPRPLPVRAPPQPRAGPAPAGRGSLSGGRNRAVLREHGVAYPPAGDTVYLRPTLAASIPAVVLLAAVYAVVSSLLLSTADATFPPETSDVLIGAAVGLVLTSIWTFSGWRRTGRSAEPPAPVGL